MSPPLSMEISPSISCVPAGLGMRVSRSTSFTVMLSTPLPVAARHPHQMRLGSPPIRYELACRFRIDTTDHLKYTLIVYTSDIQNPTSINLIRHRGDTSTIAKCSSTAVSSTSSSCSPTMFRSFLSSFFRPPRIIKSHKQSNARMGQIEATSLQRPETRALGHLRCPFLQYLHRPPSRDTSSRTLPRPSLYGYDVASQRGRAADEDDIGNFQAITASGGMNRSRGGGG